MPNDVLVETMSMPLRINDLVNFTLIIAGMNDTEAAQYHVLVCAVNQPIEPYWETRALARKDYINHAWAKLFPERTGLVVGFWYDNVTVFPALADHLLNGPAPGTTPLTCLLYVAEQVEYQLHIPASDFIEQITPILMEHLTQSAI